jgi:hypothetical protein
MFTEYSETFGTGEISGSVFCPTGNTDRKKNEKGGGDFLAQALGFGPVSSSGVLSEATSDWSTPPGNPLGGHSLVERHGADNNNINNESGSGDSSGGPTDDLLGWEFGLDASRVNNDNTVGTTRSNVNTIGTTRSDDSGGSKLAEGLIDDDLLGLWCDPPGGSGVVSESSSSTPAAGNHNYNSGGGKNSAGGADFLDLLNM